MTVGRVGVHSSGIVLKDGNALEAMKEEVGEWCVRKGWRQEGDVGTSPDALGRTFGDEMILVVTEIAEAVEAFRTDGTLRWVVDENERKWFLHEEGMGGGLSAYPDGMKPEGVPSEIADAFIRMLDTCAHYGIDLFAEYRAKMNFNESRENRHGGKKL